MSARDLTAMTVKELRALAAELNAPGRTRLRKAELVEAIEAARADRLPAVSQEPTSEEPELDEPSLPEWQAPADLDVGEAAGEVEGHPVEAEPVDATPHEAAVATDVQPQVVEIGGDEDATDSAGAGGDGAAEEERPPSGGVLGEQEPSPAVAVQEPAPAEPGATLRAMVRDPETVYVYWETDGDEPVDGWEVRAVGEGDRLMDSFRAEPSGHGGYVTLPAEAAVDVHLHPVRDGQAQPAVAVAALSTKQRVGEPAAGGDERWVAVSLEQPYGAAVGQAPPSAGSARPRGEAADLPSSAGARRDHLAAPPWSGSLPSSRRGG